MMLAPVAVGCALAIIYNGRALLFNREIMRMARRRAGRMCWKI